MLKHLNGNQNIKFPERASRMATRPSHLTPIQRGPKRHKKKNEIGPQDEKEGNTDATSH